MSRPLSGQVFSVANLTWLIIVRIALTLLLIFKFHYLVSIISGFISNATSELSSLTNLPMCQIQPIAWIFLSSHPLMGT